MNTNQIPRIIHLIGVEQQPPLICVPYVNKLRVLHPLWQITIWDDVAALALVRENFPDWEYHYNNYKAPVQRTDIFRVMLVYLYGGFYLDMDILCFKSLDDLRGHNLVLGVEKELSQAETQRLHHTYPIRIANYMFGSRAKHPFWLDFLTAARKRANIAVKCESDVLEITGPGLLTDVYHENESSYDDITLLPNEKRACWKSCGPASCHFGTYAVHLHMGSWRWKAPGNI
jgi:mannosyltransferase OCH1-like enzyme